MYKIVHNFILIETIKYIKLQINLINLQQILTNKKCYLEMCFFPDTVKDLNSLSKNPLTRLQWQEVHAFKIALSTRLAGNFMIHVVVVQKKKSKANWVLETWTTFKAVGGTSGHAKLVYTVMLVRFTSNIYDSTIVPSLDGFQQR